MDVIPEAEWCQCTPKFTFEDKQYPPKAGTAEEMKKVCPLGNRAPFHSTNHAEQKSQEDKHVTIAYDS
jgi:hypothetical protein